MATLPLDVDTRTNTVLEDYVNAADPAYQYSMVSKTARMTAFGPYTHYVLSMTSQTWRIGGRSEQADLEPLD